MHMAFYPSGSESIYNESHSVPLQAGLISISTASSQQEITTLTHNKQGQTMTVPIVNRTALTSQLTDGLAVRILALAVE